MFLLLFTSLVFFTEEATAFKNQQKCRPCNLIPMNRGMCNCIEGVDDSSCTPRGSAQSLYDMYNEECECEEWTTECNAFMDSKWDQSTELECACYLSQTNLDCKPSFQTHYRSAKDTFESLIEQQGCGSDSTDAVCVGEIDSMNERCSVHTDQESCESAGVSPFSDGVCDWSEDSDVDTTKAALEPEAFHCDDCVRRFAQEGGCECWEDEYCNEEDLVPDGCHRCGEEAAEFCGITFDEESMEYSMYDEEPAVVIEDPSDSEEPKSCCDKPRTDSGFCTMDDLLEESVPTCGKCLYDQQCENFWEAYETREEGMATGLVYCCPDAKRCVDRRTTDASPHGVGCPYTTDIAGCGYGGECGGSAANDPGYPQICTGCTQSDWYNSWMDEMTCSNTEMKSLAMQLETDFSYHKITQSILALVGVAVVCFSIVEFFSKLMKPHGDHIELDQEDNEDEI